MIWKDTENFGVGKARTRDGKIMVVAYYSPPGNIQGKFKENVNPLDHSAIYREKIRPASSSEVNLFRLFRRRKRNRREKRRRGGERGGDKEEEEENVIKVLARQQPRLAGKNATRVIAAHLLGHSASVVTTSEENVEVVITLNAKTKREREREKKRDERERERERERSEREKKRDE
ncbi:zinc finger CCCH domain-containing protein 13-like, partial [Penaeus monodon]|uniref:zinc finger CCCH domain-containing protein 13-like n=1 Tax=Penaeus monodon TaxID=6687 RepID=UPI0018A6DDA3